MILTLVYLQISPSTLRSLSSSSNTFKPFSYTAQPHSVPYPWSVQISIAVNAFRIEITALLIFSPARHQSDPTRPSIAFQFDSPLVPSSQNSPVNIQTLNILISTRMPNQYNSYRCLLLAPPLLMRLAMLVWSHCGRRQCKDFLINIGGQAYDKVIKKISKSQMKRK